MLLGTCRAGVLGQHLGFRDDKAGVDGNALTSHQALGDASADHKED